MDKIGTVLTVGLLVLIGKPEIAVNGSSNRNKSFTNQPSKERSLEFQDIAAEVLERKKT